MSENSISGLVIADFIKDFDISLMVCFLITAGALFFAVLLVMRPEEFKTAANFRDPERRPQGLEMVLINGTVVVEDGRCKADSRAGKMLRK